MGTFGKRSVATATGTATGAVDGGTVAIPAGAHIHAIAGIVGSGTPASVKPIHANIKLTSDEFHDFEPCELPLPYTGSALLGTVAYLAAPMEVTGIRVTPVDIQIPSDVSPLFNCDINFLQVPSTAGKFQLLFLYTLGGAFQYGVPRHWAEMNGNTPQTAGTAIELTEKLLSGARAITDLYVLCSLTTPTATQDAQYILDLSADILNIGDQEFFANCYSGAAATNAVVPSGWVHYRTDIPVKGGATITGAVDCLTDITGAGKAQVILGYI